MVKRQKRIVDGVNAPVFPWTILKGTSDRSACRRLFKVLNWAMLPLCMNYVNSQGWCIQKRSGISTINFPWIKGWQLSNDNEPAVVARTWPLKVVWVKISGNTRVTTYKTRGDFIFSAKRVRLALFQACRQRRYNYKARKSHKQKNWQALRK